jgi:hypothetical protein
MTDTPNLWMHVDNSRTCESDLEKKDGSGLSMRHTMAMCRPDLLLFAMLKRGVASLSCAPSHAVVSLTAWSSWLQMPELSEHKRTDIALSKLPDLPLCDMHPLESHLHQFQARPETWGSKYTLSCCHFQPWWGHLIGQQQPAQSASWVQNGDDRADYTGSLRCSYNAVGAKVHWMLLALHIELDGQILKGSACVLRIPQSLPESPAQRTAVIHAKMPLCRYIIR